MRIPRPDQNEKKEYTPPPEGTYPAKAIDFEYRGMVTKDYGKGPKSYPTGRYVYVLSTEGYDEDGEPFEALNTITNEDGKEMEVPFLYSEFFNNLSLNDASKFFGWLSSWVGRKTLDRLVETDTFDTDSFIGRACMLTISHKPKDDGGVWVNAEISRPAPNQPEVPDPEGYTPVKERESYKAPEDDPDLPF